MAPFLQYSLLLIALAALLLFALVPVWQGQLGWGRAVLAALLRAGWLAPLGFALFPRTITERVPNSQGSKPLHVLIDDSASMGQPPGPSTSLQLARNWQGLLEKRCQRLGCAPRTTLLSQLDGRTKEGMTPLSAVLPSWLLKTGGDPWLLISDGGDFRPEVPWDGSMALAGASLQPDIGEKGGNHSRGLVIGFPADGTENLAVEDIEVSPFAFEGKPVEVTVHLSRSQALGVNQRVQVQVAVGDGVAASANGAFVGKDLTVELGLVIPTLPKGVQLLDVRVLPTGNERYLWDNHLLRSVEVLPNTVGVLHLLGSPNWDGRFIRRYLKAEPKYDLISFYILRDPSDLQQVSERELSLIPFPVDRLFREELPNFRACIIQNFSLTRFLQPEYQENLVKFVQDGGGLLFIGGPRALKSLDLTSSPLRSILPFDPPPMQDSAPPNPFGLFDQGMSSREEEEEKGATYDPNMKFTIVPATPDAPKRALASVYDDWERLAAALGTLGGLQGMHNTAQFRFKEAETTPLLLAKTDGGKTMPLAVASYPGKGRALWLFSDQLWRLAMSDQWDAPRSAFNEFIGSAMSWLLRQDLRKPLLVREFMVTGDSEKEQGQWSAIVQGAAARYIEPTKDWQVEVCGARIGLDQVIAERLGQDMWSLKGRTQTNAAGGQRCKFLIEGAHGAFGSVNAASATIVPRTLDDSDIGSAPGKLRSLGKLTGAKVVFQNTQDIDVEMNQWLEGFLGSSQPPPITQKTREDRFWVLGVWWFWLLLGCLPLEVLVRRWDEWFV